MAKPAFRIKRYAHPRLKFVVRSKLSGKWVRKFFETEREAKTYVEQQEIELLNHGREGTGFPGWLRVMAQHGQERIDVYGKRLGDAVDFYVAHLERTKRSVPLEQATIELIEGRRTSGASEGYCYDLKLRLGRFCKDFAGRSSAEITTGVIDDWLGALKLAPLTRNTFRRDVRTLFSFCLTRGYCATNPVLATRKAKEIDGEVGILTVDEAGRLMENAVESALPYFAIGLFAGLRKAEILRLNWEEIDFEAALIEVTAKKSKTAKRRLVKMQPNLARWLVPFRNYRGPVCPPNLRKLMQKSRELANFAEWPSNALRHSFASYHLAHFKDAAALALEMGHTNQQMIFDHYRQVVRPAEAVRFWTIEPASKPHIVSFQSAV